TLHEGDNLLVEKLSPRFGKISRGDIVTIKNALESYDGENKTIIKRVIAIGGDTVEIKNGKVYVNDEAMTEGYINGNTTNPVVDIYTSMKVPEDTFYVMGDNRARPILDSRSIGPVKRADITGIAIYRFYPFNKIGKL
ncbi:MAG: signal peptidase I, partial [Clostridiales bacterium]|nr:signal peptidase I [Clostridiales bacterium]